MGACQLNAYDRGPFFIRQRNLIVMQHDTTDTFHNHEPSSHWCRVVMEASTEKIIKSLDYKNMKVLEISGSKWKDFGFGSYRSVGYPEFDICKETLSETFDLIIAEQVFEHLLYPYRAAKNAYTMLASGGRLFITTPFLIKYHPDPIDCTRWTEMGMKYFLEEAGFSLGSVETGSWGNKECAIANFDSWTTYDKENHSLENDPIYPLVVWVVAQK